MCQLKAYCNTVFQLTSFVQVAVNPSLSHCGGARSNSLLVDISDAVTFEGRYKAGILLLLTLHRDIQQAREGREINARGEWRVGGGGEEKEGVSLYIGGW